MKDITDDYILFMFDKSADDGITGRTPDGRPIASTWVIANLLNAKTSDVRKRLKKMEVQGLLERSKKYSDVNNIVWVKK